MPLRPTNLLGVARHQKKHESGPAALRFRRETAATPTQEQCEAVRAELVHFPHKALLNSVLRLTTAGDPIQVLRKARCPWVLPIRDHLQMRSAKLADLLIGTSP